MPVYLAPGVYVEEEERGPKPIPGVSTSNAAFIGLCKDGPPFEPTRIDNFEKFERIFGGITTPQYPLPYAVRGFFENGGQLCYVVRISKAAGQASKQFENDNGDPIFTLKAATYGAKGGAIKASLDPETSMTPKPAEVAWMHPAAVPVTDVDTGTKIVTVVYDAARTFRFAEDEMATYVPNTDNPAPAYRKILEIDEYAHFVVTLDQAVQPPDPAANHALRVTRKVIGIDKDEKVVTVQYEEGSTFRFQAGDKVVCRKDGGSDKKGTVEKVTKTGPRECDVKLVPGVGDELLTFAADKFTLDLQDTELPKIIPEFTKDITVTVRLEDAEQELRYGPGDPVTYFRAAGNETEAKIVGTEKKIKADVKLEGAALQNRVEGKATLALETPRVPKTEGRFVTVEYSPYSNFRFVEGDRVTYGDAPDVYRVVAVKKEGEGFRLELDKDVPPDDPPQPLFLKALKKDDKQLRVSEAQAFYPGSILKFYLEGQEPNAYYDVVAAKEGKRLTLARGITQDALDKLGRPGETEIKLADDPKIRITSCEFTVTLESGAASEKFENLGLLAGHPRSFAEALRASQLVTLELPEEGQPGVADFGPPADVEKYLPKAVSDEAFEGGNGDGDFKPDEWDQMATQMDEVAEVLERQSGISLLAFPGATTTAIHEALLSHCEKMKYRFAILDSPNDPNPDRSVDTALAARRAIGSDRGYGAFYYPWLEVLDDVTGEKISIPPSGHIAGVYGRSDTKVGVHKAPANEKISNVIGLTYTISFAENGALNPEGVNCLRAFPGEGRKVWGARTVSKNPSWQYVNVRRLFNYVEESIELGTRWVVFEPNNERLWARVKQTITIFLTGVWRANMLMGTTPEEAFFVRCDRTTMTLDDIDNGRLVCVIGVAPVKPAEFVIFRIAQWTAGSEVTE